MSDLRYSFGSWDDSSDHTNIFKHARDPKGWGKGCEEFLVEGGAGSAGRIAGAILGACMVHSLDIMRIENTRAKFQPDLRDLEWYAE